MARPHPTLFDAAHVRKRANEARRRAENLLVPPDPVAAQIMADQLTMTPERRTALATAAGRRLELGMEASDKAIERIETVLADLRGRDYEKALIACRAQMDDWFRRIIAAAPLADGPEWPQHDYERNRKAASNE